MDKQEILKQLGDIPEEIYDGIVQSFYEETRDRIIPVSSINHLNH